MWISKDWNYINQKKNFGANICFRNKRRLKAQKNINNCIYQLDKSMNFFLENLRGYANE